jgi:hypothetical protein
MSIKQRISMFNVMGNFITSRGLLFHGMGVLKRRKSSFQPAVLHSKSFEKLIGIENVMTDSFEIEKYTIDWTKAYKGGNIVCLPRTTEDVSKILAYCNANRIGVVPQGGNTGLVGGAVVEKGGDQLILCLEKMNAIHSIEDAVLICDGGCILENLNRESNKYGYTVPLDLGAKGACQIGGNVEITIYIYLFILLKLKTINKSKCKSNAF